MKTDKDMTKLDKKSMEQEILEVMGKARTIGLTAKQIAKRIQTPEPEIKTSLKTLKQKELITSIGRSLWILPIYKDMNKDPLFISPKYYTKEFERSHHLRIAQYNKKITFSGNGSKIMHRWSPYVQGFSAQFVEDMLNRHGIEKGEWVLDPFVGSGTVSVCTKMKGINSVGIDLMPLMAFMAKVKTRWDISIGEIKTELAKIRSVWRNSEKKIDPPFLRKTSRQFNPKILSNLLTIKHSIFTVRDKRLRDLFELALGSILVHCSNLKRSPCLGYVKNKQVPNHAPFHMFEEKVQQMIHDLSLVQKIKDNEGEAEIIFGDARAIRYSSGNLDIAITSPPYVNGMDYIINYKIEMAWLDLVDCYEDLYKLKVHMIACDNIPKKVIRNFSSTGWTYEDEWLDDIVHRIEKRVQEKNNYRRNDMHLIVRKYFEDLYQIFENVYDGLAEGRRFIIVIGDSLIAGIYVPADLILARMGERIGFSVERIENARKRRSGQRRDFLLRESIVTLVKGEPRNYDVKINKY